MDYYTLQISYGTLSEKKIEEFKDLTPGGLDLNTWITSIRERLFKTGFHIRNSPIAYEFISPFRINVVYLIKQDGKYGT